MHMVSLTSKMGIYLAPKAKIVLLIAQKVSVPVKYTDFVNVFSKKSAEVQPK